MARRLSTTILVLTLAVAILGVPAPAQQATVCDMVIYEVLPDGSVFVNATFTVAQAPTTLTIRAEAPPLLAWATDAEGNLLPVDFNDTTVTVTVYNATRVNVTYYTQALTSKEGPYWKLTVNPQCKAYLILPDDAVPTSMSPANPEAAIVSGRLAFVFPPGTINVTYMLIPGVPQAEATTTTQQEATTTIPPGTGEAGGTATAATGGAEGETGGAGEAAPEGGGVPVWLLVVVAGGVIAGLGVYLYRSRRGGTPPEPGVAARAQLDDRDRLILEALRGGPKSASEIMQETGIPKTPLYRRLRRLVEEGLVEVFEEGGVRKYRLKG